VIDLDQVLCIAQSDNICVLFDGMVHLPTAAASLTINRSHLITVRAERVARRSQGILVSYGSQDGGFILSIKDNRLTYEYYCAGMTYTIRSERELPVGNLSLRFAFTKTGHLQGKGALYLGDEPIGEAAIPHTLPYLSAGEDPRMHLKGRVGMSLSERHGAAFSGKICEVTIRSTGNPESACSRGRHTRDTVIWGSQQLVS
jgi:arylsulfatase